LSNELLMATASTWNKSQSKKMNASTFNDGRVQSANGSTWFDNYPMETLHEQYFNATWTHGTNGSGVMLDSATWGDHPRSGDSINFHGFFGFNRTALRNFVEGGVIQDIQIQVRAIAVTHAGHPDVRFISHNFTSKPSSVNIGSLSKTNWQQEKFNQTGSNITRWVKIPISHWNGGNFAGVVVYAPSATAANSLRFAGLTTSHSVTGYNTRLFISVLK
jgi:hypothetical protein